MLECHLPAAALQLRAWAPLRSGGAARSTRGHRCAPAQAARPALELEPPSSAERENCSFVTIPLLTEALWWCLEALEVRRANLSPRSQSLTGAVSAPELAAVCASPRGSLGCIRPHAASAPRCLLPAGPGLHHLRWRPEVRGSRGWWHHLPSSSWGNCPEEGRSEAFVPPCVKYSQEKN